MRNHRSLVSLLLAVLAAAGVFGAEPQRDNRPRNIILIGWDGAQREHVLEGLERGELPNLKQLTSEGSLVAIDIRGKTDTKAGWSQILTGYDPDVTGVYSNAKFQPVPKGLSVFERLKARFGADQFATVAVIGKKQHCGEIRSPSRVELLEAEAVPPKDAVKGKRGGKLRNQGAPAPARRAGKAQARAGRKAGQIAAADNVPGQGPKDIGSRIVEENGRRFRVFPGSPYYLMKDGCDQWIYGLMQDEKVGAKAIELLDQYKDKPFFFFVHFAEVDHAGHRHGENSREYNDAIISGDAWTGRIVQKLKDLGLYDQTLIYVTADHGFNEDQRNHRNAPHVILGTNDPKVSRNGDRADITPTILDRFGLDPAAFTPPLAGHSLLRPLAK